MAGLPTKSYDLLIDRHYRRTRRRLGRNLAIVRCIGTWLVGIEHYCFPYHEIVPTSNGRIPYCHIQRCSEPQEMRSSYVTVMYCRHRVLNSAEPETFLSDPIRCEFWQGGSELSWRSKFQLHHHPFFSIPNTKILSVFSLFSTSY